MMIEVLASIVALVCVFLLAIYKYLTWNNGFWTRRGISGPKPQLLVGSFPSLLNSKHHIVYDFDDIYWSYKSKARAVGIFMSRNPELLILDPGLANDILVKNFKFFRDNLGSRFVENHKKDKLAARNPFMARGDYWKSRRMEGAGGLAVSKLASAYPIWKVVAQKMTKYLKEKTKDGAVEIEAKDLAQRFTTAIMGDFLWGVDSRSFSLDPKNQQNPIHHMGKRMMLSTFAAISIYFQMSLVPFFKKFLNIRVYGEEVDTFFSMLTEEAIRLRLNQNKTDRVDYLNYVMQLQEKKNVSHDDIMGHTLTVFLNGYETTSNVIYHTLFYLAKNQVAQDRLREEIHEQLHRRQFFLFDELNALPFLDQCIHETIRLVSPLPIFSRICTEKTELEVKAGQVVSVSPGDVVTVPIFSFHHDKEYFDEPYKYKPERFDYERHSDLTKKGVFLPFGDGPRMCMGMRLGLLEAKTCVVEILKNFRLTSGPQTIEEKKPDCDSFVLGLEGDLWIQFEKL